MTEPKPPPLTEEEESVFFNGEADAGQLMEGRLKATIDALREQVKELEGDMYEADLSRDDAIEASKGFRAEVSRLANGIIELVYLRHNPENLVAYARNLMPLEGFDCDTLAAGQEVTRS